MHDILHVLNTWYIYIHFLISGPTVGTQEKDCAREKVNMKESVENVNHQAKDEICLEPINAENLLDEKFV